VQLRVQTDEFVKNRRLKYRCAGLPPGFDFRKLERATHGSLPFTGEHGKVIQPLSEDLLRPAGYSF